MLGRITSITTLPALRVVHAKGCEVDCEVGVEELVEDHANRSGLDEDHPEGPLLSSLMRMPEGKM